MSTQEIYQLKLEVERLDAKLNELLRTLIQSDFAISAELDRGTRLALQRLWKPEEKEP